MPVVLIKPIMMYRIISCVVYKPYVIFLENPK